MRGSSRPGSPPLGNIIGAMVTVIMVMIVFTVSLEVGNEVAGSFSDASSTQPTAPPPDISPALEGLVLLLGIVIGVPIAIAILLGLATLLYEFVWSRVRDPTTNAVAAVRSRRQHSVTTFGVRYFVDVDDGVAVTCSNCEAWDVGESRTFGREAVVLGIVVTRREDGENPYCGVCADDPIEGALRADRARKGLPVDGPAGAEAASQEVSADG